MTKKSRAGRTKMTAFAEKKIRERSLATSVIYIFRKIDETVFGYLGLFIDFEINYKRFVDFL